MQRATYYTLQDKEMATIILDNFYSEGKKLYDETFVEWAMKVETWFNKFYKLLSKYAKRMKSAALAMKAIWTNIKSGQEVSTMLSRMIEKTLVLASGVTGKMLKKGSFEAKDDYRMPTMKSRASKHRRFATTGRFRNLHSTK